MTNEVNPGQAAHGRGIAQADRGSTATVQYITNTYHGVRPSPPEREQREAAKLLLASLPVDTIPAPAPLPAGSTVRRVPPVNHAFVGREEELFALARSLKAGGATAV